MKDFLELVRRKSNKEIVSQKCVYCKKNVNTSNKIPICSRKKCIKDFRQVRELNGNRFINANEKLIEIEVFK